jgi:hypothetical protein
MKFDRNNLEFPGQTEVENKKTGLVPVVPG